MVEQGVPSVVEQVAQQPCRDLASVVEEVAQSVPSVVEEGVLRLSRDPGPGVCWQPSRVPGWPMRVV
ncbi:MAG: hypothetical protein Q8Q44_01530, partial [Nocardioides sp.]|nr:hypothetical protein [Nocardioides sp.]